MLKCISSFATGDGRIVTAGSLVDDKDPVVKGREMFFDDPSAPAHAPHPVVEQATAEPGERRDTSRKG